MKLNRTTLQTSHLLDFCSRKELIAQTGHEPEAWPLVILKELVDNALDACEEAGTPPVITVTVNKSGITVTDNGPGIPPETVSGVLDFTVRVSRREAYVAPDRGAQGNALKTVVAIPFVLDGECGMVEIAAQGVRHKIQLGVDRIRQEPVISHDREADENVKTGTSVSVHWPDLACSILEDGRERFLQIADDYTWLNPHLTLTVDWFGEQTHTEATATDWKKWCPSDPTCPHWYKPENFERLVAGYLAHDADRGADRTVRELVREFRGLTGSAKQKAVLEATGLARTNLTALARNGDINTDLTRRLLDSMKEHTKPVKPLALGIIGKDHLRQRVEAGGFDMETFNYRKAMGETDGVPWVVETLFAWHPEADSRRLITGVNWSPGIVNPFRSLGQIGQSLDSILSDQFVGRNEPIVMMLHMACAHAEYTDRGKSAVVIHGGTSDGRDDHSE